MTSTGLEAVLEQMWAGSAPLARTRLDVVAAYVDSLSSGAGDPVLRAEAASAAHRVAGALGSCGREGLDDASALELLLKTSERPDAGRVAGHLAALRTAVAA